MRDRSVTIRPPSQADAAEMWQLARDTLDVNSPYSYLMMAEYFAATSAVARTGNGDGDELLGFVTGFRTPDEPATLFIWQIAVSPAARGRRLAIALLDDVAARPLTPTLQFVEATITPSNEASERTFRSFATQRHAVLSSDELFAADRFPGAAHEAEHRIRIGPF